MTAKAKGQFAHAIPVQQYRARQALPTPYGGIRCLIRERKQERTAAKQLTVGDSTLRYTWDEMAEGLQIYRDTMMNLAHHRLHAVSARTLLDLSEALGGIDMVFAYDPAFTPPPRTSRPRHDSEGQRPTGAATVLDGGGEAG